MFSVYFIYDRENNDRVEITSMEKKYITTLLVTPIIGAAIGGVLGNLLGWILPEGVVKDFFLTSLSFDIGGLSGNETGVIIVDLSIITLKFGISIDKNSVHGSDSPENAKIEIDFFFKD